MPMKCCLTLVLSFLLVAPAGAAVDRLQLATQLWPPYQTLNGDEWGGVATERVQCALRRMNQPYELHMMRWDKAQLKVETNQMHGFFSGSNNATRAVYAVPSIPVISENLSWFVSPNLSLNLEDETAKYQARYSAKFNTNKWLSLKKEGYNVVKKPRDASALAQMLWQGDIDVALEYELVFEHSMAQLGIPENHFRKIAKGRQNLSVHFSKEFLRQNPGFLDTFNQALTLCIENES